MKNKSQVTVYVIIGLLLVGVFGIILYNNSKKNIDIILDSGSTQDISLAFLEAAVNDCLYSLILESIDFDGICSDEILSSYIINNIAGCINSTNYELMGYTVEMNETPKKVKGTISKEEIFVSINYPMIFTKNDNVIEFSTAEYTLYRTNSLTLNLDSNSKVIRDQILVSTDLGAELLIPRGTKVNSDKIEVYLKEMCPDDSSTLGKIKYQYSPHDIEFEPNAILTIRYEDNHVSRLSAEESFKLVFVNGSHWQPIASSANIEKNKIIAATSHLSDWAASCFGSNKYGIQLMIDDVTLNDEVDQSILCAESFSGSCGYAKVNVYLNPMQDNYLEYYKDVFDKIYDNQLIPIITLLDVPTPSYGEFLSHPGYCNDAPSYCKHEQYSSSECTDYSLDCYYGEDSDGENFPRYYYGEEGIQDSSVDNLVKLLDTIHSDKKEWPLFIEIGNEPNLANNWHDISLTSEEVIGYSAYYITMARAIRNLNHAESIKVMPAGLAPTSGNKKCELSPEYAKEFHLNEESHKVFEADDYFLKKEDCSLLGYISDYNKDDNFCSADSFEQYVDPISDCIFQICGTDSSCTPTPAQMSECACPVKQTFFDRAINGYEYYVLKDMDHVFSGLSDGYNTVKGWTCDASNYNSEVEIEKALLITKRIRDTFKEYCFEKITEVSAESFISAFFSTPGMCEYVDLYADHIFMDSNSLDVYPGGESPYGVLSYEQRFDLVSGYCSKLKDIKCTAPDDTDTDEDGLFDHNDNCPQKPNSFKLGTCTEDVEKTCESDDDCSLKCQMDQEDWDIWTGDGKGDVCDDSDGDEVLDIMDVCPTDSSIKVLDDISSAQGKEDADNDNFPNSCDNCPNLYNPNQMDRDGNLVGDVCEDLDGDNVPNIGAGVVCTMEKLNIGICIIDNCPHLSNLDQLDEDEDKIGNLCDNCVNVPNPNQIDKDGDGIGYQCDDDEQVDICPNIPGVQTNPDECPPQDLCIGNVIITQTAWAPHPKDKIATFLVDDYVENMKKAYEQWTNDPNILAIIPYHLGDKSLVDEKLKSYSWTKELCEDKCVGTKMFNEIGKITNPVVQCGEGPGPFECKDSIITLQNLGKEVGKDRLVYTCKACEETTQELTKESYPAGPFSYDYVGLRECFEVHGETPGEHGGIDLLGWCPDGDGTVRDGIPCSNFTMDGVEYIGLIRCEPSATSTKAWVHVCGTLDECGGDASNCCAGGEYYYGHYWHACKGDLESNYCYEDTQCGDETCITQNVCQKVTDDCEPLCEGSMQCISGECKPSSDGCESSCESDFECVIDGSCQKKEAVCGDGTVDLPIEDCDPEADPTYCGDEQTCTDNCKCEDISICVPECETGFECIIDECIEISECDPACTVSEFCVESNCVECELTEHCSTGDSCIENVCITPECHFDSDCVALHDEGYYCDLGVCKENI